MVCIQYFVDKYISIFISLVLVFICTCTLTNVLFSSDSIASDMLNTFVHFHDKGVPVRIDTARIVRIYSYSILILVYPHTNSKHIYKLQYAGGESEVMLGNALTNLDDTASGITLGTKAHPSQPNGLSSVCIRSQLQTSLDAMKVSSVNEFYLHQPDEENSLLDSLKTLNELVNEG